MNENPFSIEMNTDDGTVVGVHLPYCAAPRKIVDPEVTDQRFLN